MCGSFPSGQACDVNGDVIICPIRGANLCMRRKTTMVAKKNDEVSRLEAAEILHTLTAANNGAGMVVRKIQRLLDKGKIFPPAYALLLLREVCVCGAESKVDRFQQLCECVAEKLKAQAK